MDTNCVPTAKPIIPENLDAIDGIEVVWDAGTTIEPGSTPHDFTAFSVNHPDEPDPRARRPDGRFRRWEMCLACGLTIDI